MGKRISVIGALLLIILLAVIIWSASSPNKEKILKDKANEWETNYAAREFGKNWPLLAPDYQKIFLFSKEEYIKSQLGVIPEDVYVVWESRGQLIYEDKHEKPHNFIAITRSYRKYLRNSGGGFTEGCFAQIWVWKNDNWYVIGGWLCLEDDAKDMEILKELTNSFRK